MPSEWAANPPYDALDQRYGHVVEPSGLKGAWFRRALILVSKAELYGADSEGFRAWQARSPEKWRDADPKILASLSRVRVDSDVNT